MSNPYESEQFLAEYLLFHYGSPCEVLPWDFGPTTALDFPVRTTAWFDRANPVPSGSALDLGCAVGRSTFELARRFDEVIGLDFSHRFIAAASTLRNGDAIDYLRRDEGGLTTPLQARWHDPVAAAKTLFVQGDAMALPADWSGFAAVHAANLLCRLPDPMRLIARLPTLLRPGGLLVLATPCTWLEEFTPASNWLGGYADRGTPVRTIDRLRALLTPHFDELALGDEPLLIREHQRKFQWTVALTTLWRRHPS